MKSIENVKLNTFKYLAKKKILNCTGYKVKIYHARLEIKSCSVVETFVWIRRTTENKQNNWITVRLKKNIKITLCKRIPKIFQ